MSEQAASTGSEQPNATSVYIIDATYGVDEDRAPEFEAAVRAFLAEALPGGSIDHADIGVGAGWPAYLVEHWEWLLPTAYAVFMSAQPIEKNLETWNRWTQAVVGFIRKVKGARYEIRVSLEAALAIAIDDVLRTKPKQSLRLVEVISIINYIDVVVIHDEEVGRRDEISTNSAVPGHTDRIFVFELDSIKVHCVAVKRDGTVVEVLRHPGADRER